MSHDIMISIERCSVYITAIGNCLGRHDFPGDGCRSWERGHWPGRGPGRSLGFYSILPSSIWPWLPWLSSDGRVHFLKGDFPGTCLVVPRQIAGWILKSSKDPSWPNGCWKSMVFFPQNQNLRNFFAPQNRFSYFSGKRCTLWLWHSQFAMENPPILKFGKPSISMGRFPWLC